MKKIIKYLLFILIILIIVLILRQTYSKYANQSIATVQENVGQWIIKLNGLDITVPANQGRKFLNLTDFIWENNNKVAANHIAPGSKGYFKIVVDATGTDTSIEYTIDIDLNDFVSVYEDDDGNRYGIDFRITRIREEFGDRVLDIENVDNHLIISRVKELSEIQSAVYGDSADRIRIDVEWVNNDIPAADEVDTKFGSIPDATATIPVTFHAIQYVGGSTP